MGPKAPPFAIQRLILMAMIIGMTMFLIVAGVILQTNDGIGLADPPLEILDTVAGAAGTALIVAGLAIKALLSGRAARMESAERNAAMFRARLIPIAVLEGACLLCTVTWLLNGNAVPALAVALVALAAAIAIVPFRDPDEGLR